MSKMQKETRPELYGLHAANPFTRHNSSPRGAMFSAHLTQSLVIEGATERIIQTGIETELGKYTNSIQMPTDGIIIKIIDRYPFRPGVDFIKENPETVVIYQDVNTLEYGCFSIPKYGSLHQHFAFKYKGTSNLSKIVPGEFFSKGSIFADSPNVTENGGYKYGIQLNLASMSHPAVSEDGILISRDVLPRLRFNLYEKREISFGNKYFPLNLYGTKDYYQPFPEIGENIRDHGILMMLREHDIDLSPVTQSIYDTMRPDHLFDKPIYVRGKEGKVVDIEMYHDNNANTQIPFKIMSNVLKYDRALKAFYLEILQTEETLRQQYYRKYGTNSIKITKEFHTLLVYARAVLSADTSLDSKQKLTKLMHKEPMDDFHIVFTIEYTITPKEGFKLAGCHGDKGVICYIEEPENMPVDSAGNRADIIMDSRSTLSRMNLGRLFEQYIAASARDMSISIRKTLNIEQDKHKHIVEQKVTNLYRSNPRLIESVYENLLHYYGFVSENQFAFYESLSTPERLDHLIYIIQDGIKLLIQTDNSIDTPEIIRQIEKYYPPTYGPVTYVGYSGNKVTTKYPVRIGPLYFMLLEKIVDSTSSTSSARLHPLGVLAVKTKSNRHVEPVRSNPVKMMSETENRIYVSYADEEAVCEKVDRNTSSITHTAIIRNLLKSEHPTNIDSIVNRDQIEFGGGKPLQLFNHIALCTGYQTIYVPEERDDI